jgi:hypothetical protein
LNGILNQKNSIKNYLKVLIINTKQEKIKNKNNKYNNNRKRKIIKIFNVIIDYKNMKKNDKKNYCKVI